MFIDSRDLRLLAVQGLTMAEIARELKQPYFRVRKSCQLYGIDVRWDVPGKPPKAKAQKLPKMPKAPKPPRIDPNAERNAKMVTMFRQGLTLQVIGNEFGITRERVRQILSKQGIDPQDGGSAKAARAKRDAAKAKRDARSLAAHGLPHAEYRDALAAGLVRAYRHQKNSARCRGIEWGLNLAQWLDVWKTSGKLDQRGRGVGKYVMSRIKDAGGYVVGNVHIKLATENSQEGFAQATGKHKANIGVFCLYPGLSRPWLAKIGKEVVGRYATEEEAVEGRRVAIESRGYAVGKGGRVLPFRLRKAA